MLLLYRGSVKAPTGNHWCPILVNHVFYVPDVKKNILSDFLIIDYGLRVLYDAKKKKIIPIQRWLTIFKQNVEL